MFAKILAVSALVACAQAGVFELGHGQHASSYSSINQHVAPVAHYAAPVAHYAAAPVAQYAAPVAHYAAAPVAHYAAPVVKAVHQEVYADTHPQYSYEYGVQDAHTGDVKNQHEERDGDVVKGYYTLVQPDGVTRTVHYTADSHNGFNAEVEYKGEPIVQKAVVAKTIVAAPVYNEHWSSYYNFHRNYCFVHYWNSLVFDVSVETMVCIRCVMDNTSNTIRLDQHVESLDDITVAFFVLDSVFKIIMRRNINVNFLLDNRSFIMRPYRGNNVSYWCSMLLLESQELWKLHKLLVMHILAISAVVAFAQGGVINLHHDAHATSFSSLNFGVPVAHVAPVAAVAHVAPLAHVAPVAHITPVVAKVVAPVIKKEIYADVPAHYSYEYGVKDSHTGDIKDHHEERNGDVVKGFYTLVQPDGVTRTVHYTSDAHNGFNANVEYKGEPIVQKAVVAKAIVPVKVTAPVYHAYHH
ncbi:PREDICTED: uncharacterized protein LOC108568246 [Nicrophorus vespilloides]|uniref:Uncharacterized protein LOC108568246 n=1 Tax=Nicrophorus vespilloides TaxID=110193 RepID=A0ABM1ND09_NICVS|nr:PREDICTED: uncharacterized protein LOC108568246 [Nicrophorus vespilloides]